MLLEIVEKLQYFEQLRGKKELEYYNLSSFIPDILNLIGRINGMQFICTLITLSKYVQKLDSQQQISTLPN